MAKSNEPLVWSLFSAGGVISAFLVPILIVLLGIAMPLNLVTPDYTKLLSLVSHPLTRIVLFFLIALSLMHWAHRFRFTLVDLGLKSLSGLIAFVCYGAAIVGTIVAGIQIWKL